MSHYLYKLIPSRPTFDLDMTEAEAAIMRQHVGYWRGLITKGTVIAFGPVTGDPAGSWGLAVVEADTEEDVRALGSDDPAVNSGMATFDVYAMPGAIIRSDRLPASGGCP